MSNLQESVSTRFTKDTTNMSLIYEAINRPNEIDERTRQKMTELFTKVGLDGNGRFNSVGEALSKVSQVLDSMGYSLDMVSNDIEVAQAHHKPGMKGQRLLTFRPKHKSEDAFTEEPEIENSRIAFAFENLGRTGGPNIEVVAYAS